MLRLIIYILLAFVIWKIVRISTTQMKRGRNREVSADVPPTAPFREAQDAEFEDLTSTSPKDPQS